MSRKTHAAGTRTVADTAVDNQCYCGGGPAHAWKPNGGGNRILACPTWAPAPKPTRTARR